MDSLKPASPLTAIWPSHLPGWALPLGREVGDLDAAFAAVIALKSLDDLVRTEPVWSGC
ncbi:DUF1403 family protein [Mesorhizobium sp. KR1-2]|uniref:DUF1403 family protein n=1 Tax=Mesorhizobium sp. KR1-2 TaxID=3156609 RepID=UPI0032B4509F